MAQRSKKSESIEVRLSHELKQEFMSKAAVEGRTASDVLRLSIADYLHGAHEGRGPGWQAFGAIALAGIILLFAYSVSSSAAVGQPKLQGREALNALVGDRQFDALRARLTYNHADLGERRRLAKEYGQEFASQRVLFMAGHSDHRAFRDLDFDSNGQLSLIEYRRWLVIPAGDKGRALFQSQDHNRDGWLSKREFSLSPSSSEGEKW